MFYCCLKSRYKLSFLLMRSLWIFITTRKRNDLLSTFGWAYTKIGTIQRRLAWPLRKDDTQNREAFHIFCVRSIMLQAMKNENSSWSLYGVLNYPINNLPHSFSEWSLVRIPILSFKSKRFNHLWNQYNRFSIHILNHIKPKVMQRPLYIFRSYDLCTFDFSMK